MPTYVYMVQSSAPSRVRMAHHQGWLAALQPLSWAKTTLQRVAPAIIPYISPSRLIVRGRDRGGTFILHLSPNCIRKVHGILLWQWPGELGRVTMLRQQTGYGEKPRTETTHLASSCELKILLRWILGAKGWGLSSPVQCMHAPGSK